MISKTGKFRACRGNHPAALIMHAVFRLSKSQLLNFWFFYFKTKEQEKIDSKIMHQHKTTQHQYIVTRCHLIFIISINILAKNASGLAPRIIYLNNLK